MIIDELLRQKEATAEQWMFKFQHAENEIARLRAHLDQANQLDVARIHEIARLRSGMKEYACTGSDMPCGCYNEFVRDTAEIERLRATQERRWCTVCGTVSRDDSCDCTAEGKAAQFVNYADEQNRIARELQAEVERLRSRR